MGVRDRYDYTDAMLHHSLFTDFLRKNGMSTDPKDEWTKDVICIDFQFGLRSFEEEIDHLMSMRASALEIEDEDERKNKLAVIDNLEKKTIERKDLYRHMSKDEIRMELYVHGAPITYSYKDKASGETIVYRMLYRNPSKAKEGSCMFIREELYDKAREWMTMGLADKMDYDNAKIVEISAYAPLSASAVEGRIKILPEEIVILNDYDSVYRTIADIVKTVDYQTTENIFDEDYYAKTGKKRYIQRPVTKKRCIIEREETDVVNTIWDGMALIDTNMLPYWCNGMALLRNHFFKACAFRTNIQEFYIDYCSQNNIDYENYKIVDMFGCEHYIKNVKLITTDNAIKWKKFVDIMGGDLRSAYDYWIHRIEMDGFIFGIVKTDHPSKLGNVQQMSYQMINTLPCTKDEIDEIVKTSRDYVELLKRDDNAFIDFLIKNETAVNHYEMLVSLYEWNSDIKDSRLWRENKSRIIKNYIGKLRRGKITIVGDNLTVCGNPYALLLHSVGSFNGVDPTFPPGDDSGAIQVYTTRFPDGEMLCGIRSPNNSSNNLGYFKNVRNELMERYFDFSCNIMAINCIHTDVQARMNGEDSIEGSVLGKLNSKDNR